VAGHQPAAALADCDGEGLFWLLSGAIRRQIEANQMTDKIINLAVSPKELEVLREVLEASDSDAPEVTAVLDRVNELAIGREHPTAAETQS
jgi:hypothetical protein